MVPALALLAASTAPVVPHFEIALSDRAVRAGDIAIVAGHESTVIATIPKGRETVELDEEKRMRLLRNRFPGIPVRLRHTGTIVLRAAENKPVRRGTCFAARTDIPAGTVLLREDVTEIRCTGEPVSRMLGYDREKRAIVARGTVPAGGYLGAIRMADRQPVERGARLTYRTAEGPVTVERQVEALQPGYPGRKLYVRTEDGEVIVAPLARPSQEDIP